MVVRLKPIVPGKLLNVATMQREIDRAVFKTLQAGSTEFKKTTRTWETVVVFVIDGPNNFRGSVGTNSDIYNYVARGTRPHLITPKRGKFLSWESGTYRAKSTPGVLGSKSAGLIPTGGVGQAIFARSVRHPGTKARGYEQAVAKRLQLVFERNVTAAILKAMG